MNQADCSLISRERIHGSLFMDHRIYEAELAHIWLESWLFVGHESEVREPGDYCVKTVGTQPVVMTRTVSGEVRLLFDRCAHFGVRLCNLERGNATTFRCPYHGWTFSNDGELVGVPFPARYPDPASIKKTGGLARVQYVESYRGFVFANFATGSPPQSFQEYLGPAARDVIDRLVGISPSGELEFRAGWLKHRIGANWKLVTANQVDGYHVRVTHGSLFEGTNGPRADFDYGKARLVHPRHLGGGHTELDFRPGYRASDIPFQWFGHVPEGKLRAYRQAMHDQLGAEQAHQVLVDGPPHALIFPNLFISELSLYVMEPDGVGSTLASSTPLLIPGQSEFNERSLRRMEGGMGPAGMLIADDAEVAERTQHGMAARRPEWLDTSRGLTAERTDESGTFSENMSDETAIRGFWGHYVELMAGAVATDASLADVP